MNISIIGYILGIVLKLESIMLLVPCVVSVIYKEKSALSFLIAAVACFACGMLLSFRKPKNKVFYLKEGCVCVSLSWIALSLFGALPFVISGEIPSITDALFETISGFTTTGASILSDVEALSHGMLFWRSFTHWIGGMGILVFVLAIFPMTGGWHMYLMKAESPGPTVEKFVPRVKNTAKILYQIYAVMTVAMILILIIAGMPIFDSLCLSFGTAGTGGFAIKNDSIAGYAPNLQIIITIFMIAFGVNFNAYFLIINRKTRKALHSEEVRVYFFIILAAVTTITINIYTRFDSVATAIRHAAFQVASVMTTTGYGTDNFDEWGEYSKMVLLLLMIVGACAGSTGGGAKVSRILIAFKAVVREVISFCHPHSVKKVKMDGKPIEDETVRSVITFMSAYFIIMFVSVLLLSIEGHDLITNFSAVVATLNNIGPGFGKVNAVSNFGFYSGFSKYVMMFDMLAGRLELFPLLLLIVPDTWRRR